MRQGLDMSECALATRIRERYLVAIEEDRPESLPDPAYVRGFTRAYASYLGVPMEGPEKELPMTQGIEMGRPPVQLSPVRPRGMPVPRRRRRWSLVFAMGFVIAIVVAGAALASGVLDFGV